MRWSLRSAIVGWVVLGCVELVYPAAVVVVLLWPIAFTLLWLAHVVTFGFRGLFVVMSKNESNRDEIGIGVLTRRRVIWFAQFASVAVAASAMLPRFVSAQGQCPQNMHLCSDGKHCCPNGASYDCLVDTCNPGKSHTCYRATDENLKYVQQCCPQLINC